MPLFIQKIIAWFLIGLLFFEATFRIPFLLPEVEALEAQNHEDIVSILVEEQLFKKMSADIDTYARRIQAQLPRTRTVILIYAKDAHPFLIASANERLYTSGLPDHGSKTQKLVGTILVGHVPIPVVHKDGRDFLSIYPYTDFSQPNFFWNWDTNRYEYIGYKPKDPRPDIWHSVIDPNSGNIDTDISKIRTFLSRVYDYDAKRGQYQNVGKDPQVLYMDSQAESRAISPGLLGVYEKLHVPQQENLLYHRYTRQFAQYFYSMYLSLMNSQGTNTVMPFSDWKKSGSSVASFLDHAGDITTKVFGDELIVPFLQVINEKYLGDVTRWVHNTGRYYNGYSDVSVDTIPEMISKKDELTGQILKQLNDTLEKIIDTYIDQNMAMDIPLLVSRDQKKTITEKVGLRWVTQVFDYTYDNYFYGKKAADITDASQCSLIRGSTFGGYNTRVEVNHGYTMTDAQTDMKKLNQDVAAGISCKNPTQSYWGGNSPINAKYTDGEVSLGTHRYDDFSQPILDLSGGNTTTDALASPLDCLKQDLILRPYKYTSVTGTIYPWPTETSGARYSCITDFNETTPYPVSLNPSPEGGENILTSLISCPPSPQSTANISLLDRTGGSLATCQTNGLTGTYKRISSLVKHADPSLDVYAEQLKAISAPHMPVDEERYVSYLDREGREGSLVYPNLFDISIAHTDSDDVVAQKITALLSATNAQLVPGKAFAGTHPWSNLVGSSASAPRLSDVILNNSDIKAGLIDALRWRNLDSEAKYAHVFDLTLDAPKTQSKLILPDKKDVYEISYLGGQGDARNFAFGFSPEEKTEVPDWVKNLQALHAAYNNSVEPLSSDTPSDFSLSAAEISALTNGGGDTSGQVFECGDPNGVVIWKWLSAIQCWLANLLKTKWFVPKIDDLFPEPPSITVSLNGQASWTTKTKADIPYTDDNNNGVSDYVENNTRTLSLSSTLSDTIIDINQTVRVDATLENATSIINDDGSRIDLFITEIDDLDTKKKYYPTDKNWNQIQDEYINISGSPTLKDGHVSWIMEGKNNHRARIYTESRIYSANKVFLSSETSILLIGPTVLPVTLLSSASMTSPQTLEAGDAQGISLVIGDVSPMPTKIDIDISDYVTGKQLITLKNIALQNKGVRIPTTSLDSIYKRSGKYTLSVHSGELAGETTFTIVPSSPDHVAMNLPAVLIKDKTQNISLAVQDIYNNNIDPENWSLNLSTSSPILLSGFGDGKYATKFTGKFKNTLNFIPQQSGNIDFNILATSGDSSLKKSFSRSVLADVKVVADIPNRDTLEVGQKVTVGLSVQRQDGTIVESWDTPLTLDVKGGNAKLETTKIVFEKGRGKTILDAGTKSGPARLYISDTILGAFVGDSFTIQSTIPNELTLSVSDKIFAQPGASEILGLQLHDKYGNLTSLHGHTWFFDIDHDELLQPIPYPSEKSEGIFTTRITSTGKAGRVLFHAWLVKDGKKSSIPTLENVAQFNVLPVITSEHAAKNTWQNITQILLGSLFGQTPIQGYFAGSVLFAPETKTLAISTLIDQPQNPIFTVIPTGNIPTQAIKYGTGVDVRIENFHDKVLSLIVGDDRLGDLARIVYPAFGTDVSYSLCTQNENDALCDHDTMAFVPVDKTITTNNGTVLQNNQTLFALRDVFNLPNLQLGFINQDGSSLQFSVVKDKKLLGVLALRWKSRIPDIDDTKTGTYDVQLLASSLDAKLSWSQTSSHDIPSAVVFTRGEQLSYLGGPNNSGWSNYGRADGQGWTGENVSLLQFASGQNWSSAQKDSSDYLTINLGDPLINLPAYKTNAVTGLDQTLGEPVYMSDSVIKSMTFRDVNSDGKKDLIVIEDNGTVGTRLNRGDGTLLDVGDLLSIPNALNGMIRSGDFIGDGYADVVYVDSEGVLHFISHTADGPIEKSLQYDHAPVVGAIEQLEVFDMDHDGIDDIIVMDTIGNLFVFYGQKSGVFVAQFIENVYKLVLGSEPKASYFTGAVSYDGPGYIAPDVLKKSSDIAILSKQNLIEQTLFTRISVPGTEGPKNTPVPQTLGASVYDSLNTDNDGFLRGYDGDSVALGNDIKNGFDDLAKNNPSAINVLSDDSVTGETLSFLKAPFINPKNLLITKKYVSLEASDTLIAGSPIEATLELKNTSSRTIKNIMLLEQFPSFMNIADRGYEVQIGDVKKSGTFSENGETGVADLSDFSLSPGQSLKVVYRGMLQSFSFGQFDVGYLEDKNDPNTGINIDAQYVRTIHPVASKLSSIPEKDFYNHDVYGDIRFNPNKTCGGPLLLWRSHNTYERTYYKTLIVRDIKDPDEQAVDAGQNPGGILTSFESSDTSSPTTASSTPSLSDIQKQSQADLATWQSDSNGDGIPDRGGAGKSEIFSVSTSGNVTQLSIGLGKLDNTIGDITNGVKKFLSGLSCGFGDAGCISMPINWAANIPGNTLTALGFPIPKANQPPLACYADVRCGYPIFSAPTEACAACEYECEEWPPCPDGAGGAFDYHGGSGTQYSTTSSSTIKTFTGGDGMSTFRIFIGATLTGAVAQVMCFGKNTQDNVSMGKVGLFPVIFTGNCIFATEPLTQCKDDGSGQDPLVTEMDISSELGTGDNTFTNADSCGFYTPITAYPTDLSDAVAQYFLQPNATNTDLLESVLSQHTDLIVDPVHATESGLSIATAASDDTFGRMNGIRGVNFNSGTTGGGMIQVSLDPTKLNLKNFGKVLDIRLRSIKAFPGFIMDWYHRQLDEIISSIGHLPDIKIFLPDLTSLADGGLISSFASGAKEKLGGIVTGNSSTTSPGTTPAQPSLTGSVSTPVAPNTAAPQPQNTTPTTNTSTAATSSSNASLLKSAGSTIKNGWNTTFDTLQKGTSYVGNTVSKGLGYADAAKNTATSFIQDKTTGIKNAFEYLGTLPIIDVHPQTVAFQIPWVGKQEAQAWLLRNQAILESWQRLPATTVNSVNIAPLVSSIQTNIEIVRSYLQLPEMLQNLFYIKEKLLYGIVQNVQAVQNLLGGWLYNNGLRFKAWVEVFILVTKLWDLWQILIDVFDDYEAQCGVCRNERWNLQNWLWIIISMIIPPIPVIQMPRWPDIELDLSDLDLSLNIAYPVFNLSFYPINLPDAPIPTISGFGAPAMPLLPRLPNLNVDINIPVIRLPQLPDLPPPPKIPELSQAIQVVLKIFKLIVLIQCLYRKVPLSPEWYVGTKVAHKTERQGFLPFDFLSYKLPSVTTQWLDAIRVSTHVKLKYNVEHITDMIKSTLEPFNNFPRNLGALGNSSGSSTVNIDIKPETGVQIDTADIHELPDLIGQLYSPDIAPSVTPEEAQGKMKNLLANISLSSDRKNQFASILSRPSVAEMPELSQIQDRFHNRFDTLQKALALDISENAEKISHLVAWTNGTKKPEDIPWIASALPNVVHLTQSTPSVDHFLSLDPSLLHPLAQIMTTTAVPVAPANMLAVAPVPENVATPGTSNNFMNKAPDTTTLSRTRGLYVTNSGTTQRLIDYTENLNGETVLYSVDDDNDGDQDVYYSLGNVVYRKENRQKKLPQYHISDAPRVYDTNAIYAAFFALKKADIKNLSGDAQISLLRSHSYGNINYRFLTRSVDAHMRLSLFSSLFQTNPRDAVYTIDVVPKKPNLETTTVFSIPQISTTAGRAFIQHNGVYRTLITNQQFIGTDGKVQSLPSDFIIREGQSGYAQKTTALVVTVNGKNTNYTLRAGQGITFGADSSVHVRRGALILPGSSPEKRLLTPQDTGLPLLPTDEIITDDTGAVTIAFPDQTQTKLEKNQHWIFRDYDPEIGIQEDSFPVGTRWYYASMQDARSLETTRMPTQTLFDAYSRSDNGATVSQIPREISLTLDKLTEVDFQKYFPVDTLSSVEILRLPASEWRRVNKSTVAFQMQKEKKDITVRVTTNGFVRDYITTLVTRPPLLGIESVDEGGNIVGDISQTVDLPLGIQSVVGGKSWTIGSSVSVKGTDFTTTIPRNATFDISYDKNVLATLDRTSGTMSLSAGTTLASLIVSGRALGYTLSDKNGKKLQMNYQGEDIKFLQINDLSGITTSGIFVVGSGIRLEPSAMTDQTLPGGAYITDTNYRPLLALDKQGVVRYIDSTVQWSVALQGKNIVYTLTRDKNELGRLVIHGDMVTAWGGE